MPDGARVSVAKEGSDEDPKGDFKDHKEFFGAVMDAARARRVDPRLLRFLATQGSTCAAGSDSAGMA